MRYCARRRRLFSEKIFSALTPAGRKAWLRRAGCGGPASVLRPVLVIRIPDSARRVQARGGRARL